MLGDTALNFLMTSFLCNFPSHLSIPHIRMASIESTSCGSSATNLGLSMGPALIGTWISLVFYGVSLSQWYPKDTLSMKTNVVVFALDTAHKFLLCAGIWNHLVQYYGDLLNLLVVQSSNWVLNATFIKDEFGSRFVSVIVQSYFAYRVWFPRGSFKWIFPAVLTAFYYRSTRLYCESVEGSVFGVTSNSMLLNLANASNGIAQQWILSSPLLCAPFSRWGGRDLVKRPIRCSSALSSISLNTGLWTAILALLSIVLGVYYPLCSLYCNTLLANLNIRPYLRGGEQVYRFSVAPTLTNRSTAPATSFMLDITAENSKAGQAGKLRGGLPSVEPHPDPRNSYTSVTR
ncbi:hypothetical protein BU15DRAFT_62724 [Melanogaster broomeanus]|nr:hypothetical protein BU15DRAFT_62724 [Melanogaster broomeanus]